MDEYNYDGLFIISEEIPIVTNRAVSISSRPGSIGWYNPIEEELKIWVDGEWKNASIKNYKGINEHIVIDGKTAKFKKGILVSYE
jgi:hypothetical protein